MKALKSSGDELLRGATFAQSGATQRRMVAQLLLSHILAGGCAIVLFLWLRSLGLQSSWLLCLALAGGGILGVLLTLNLLYGTYVIELALERFAQGLPVNELGNLWRWPLQGLFAALSRLNQRMTTFAHNEQLTTEFREQMLQQASESAALAERNHIARELHDSIKQQIFSISMSAAAVKAYAHGDEEDVREAVEDIQRSAKEAQVEMQALLQQLRSSPLENTSLAEALQTQAQALGFRIGGTVQVEIGDLPPSDNLPPNAPEMLFRIVQESFANIARHARASLVTLRLFVDNDALHIAISDDGQGFDMATVKRGMGLANLHERAALLGGTLTMQSAQGQGTSIHIRIPLLVREQNAEAQARVERNKIYSVQQAQQGFQLGFNMLGIAMALMGANMAFLTSGDTTLSIGIVVCALLAFYGYVRGYYHTTRVAINAGRDALETLTLDLQHIRVRGWLLRMLCMGVWYVGFLWRIALFSPYWWVCIVVTALMALWLQFERRSRSLAKDRYNAKLATGTLKWETEQARQRLNWRLRVGIIAGAITLLTGRAAIIIPPLVLHDWIADGITVSLLLWIGNNLLEYRQVRHWARIVAEREMKQEATHGG